MKAVAEQYPQLFDASGYDAERLFTDLADTDSLWYELRIVQMPACDYIFIPKYITNTFKTLEAVNTFFSSLQTIATSDITQTTFITYCYAAGDTYNLEKLSLQYSGNDISYWRCEGLEVGGKHFDFINTMLSHSESLIIQDLD